MKRPKVVHTLSRADLDRFGTVPRDVRLTPGGWTVVVFALVFAIAALTAALGLPILRASQQAKRARFDLERVVTDATITSVTIERNKENRQRVVSYRYAAEGGEYKRSVRLQRRDPLETVEGGHLRIVYLPSEPGRSWLYGRGPGMVPIWVLPLVPTALLLLAGSLASVVRRERTLLAEGRFTTARVTSYKKVSGSHGHSYRVTYEFTTLGGTKVKAKTDRTLAQDVTTVAVVYHRENPRWNAIYPTGLAAPVRQ